MARPKKTDSDELVAIVDSYFTTEAAGNPAKLKCSLLEEYAARRGKQAKAYAEARSEVRSLTVENRYLRKMLRTYLYPALANEILKEENQMKKPDTEVTPLARNQLIDGKFPSSASEALSGDLKMLSREEELLRQMWDSIPEVTT